MKIYAIRLAAAMLALLLLLLTATACRQSGGLDTAPPESVTNPTGDTAPDFTVLDVDGNEVSLSDFFGTPIVLNFWASWCPPCKAELPDFEAACKKYEGKVTFLMVNMTDGRRETVEIAKDFITSEGYAFPVYFDTRYEASYAYGISSIPTTYFINADGTLEAQATGMISAAQLEQGIGMIYGG